MAVDHGPDLVLMDVKLLDNSDGIAAAGQILERTGIRCLMATGQTDAKTKARAALVQPLGWLPKPYGNEEMVKAVANALRCKVLRDRPDQQQALERLDRDQHGIAGD